MSAIGYDGGSGGALAGLGVGYGHDTSGRRNRVSAMQGTSELAATQFTYFGPYQRLATVTHGGVSASYDLGLLVAGLPREVVYAGNPGIRSVRTADAAGRLDKVEYFKGEAWNGTKLTSTDYTLDDRGRRTATLREDGTSHGYGYNPRGELTSASQGGAAFTYGYDDIGNRQTARVAGIAEAGQTTVYEADAVNQYSAVHNPDPAKRLVQGRTVAGAGLMMYAGNGDPAAAAEPVPVARNGGTEYTGTVSASVTEGAALKKIHIKATRQAVGVNGGPVTTMREAWLYFPPKDEVPTYDQDGNLTGDDRWRYWWDAENRLKAMEEKERVPPAGVDPVALPARQRLEFEYDSQSRRVRKVVRNAGLQPGEWALVTDTRFLYDGWNVIAEFESGATGPVALKQTYAWGLDLSGTTTGAGGVGGLLFVSLYSPSTTLAPAYDGNGNILAYLDCATGNPLARYEYDPFGRVMQKEETAAVASRLHHQFSTKYTDDETGLSYYGYRYYAPEMGRWLSMDPIGEKGGPNVYEMVGNDPINSADYLGLLTTSGTLYKWQDVHGNLTWSDGTVEQVRSVAELTQVINSRGHCDCVKSLHVMGHGSREMIELGQNDIITWETLTSGAVRLVGKSPGGTVDLAELLNLCSDAVVVFDGCNTARQWPWSDDDNLTQAASRALPNTQVYGNRGIGIGLLPLKENIYGLSRSYVNGDALP